MAIDRELTKAKLGALKAGPPESKADKELTAYRAAKADYLKRATVDDVLAPFDDGFVSGLENIEALTFEDDLIEGVVPSNELGAIIGNSNVGKTFLSATMLKAVAAGSPFNGHSVEKGGAFYIGSEGDKKFERRRAALYRRMSKDEATELGLDAGDFKVGDPADTFLSTFDFPVGKDPEKACAQLYRLACQFRARRNAFPSLIVVDHLMALQPRDAVGFDWQISLTAELRALKNVAGCTVIVLVHENKAGEYYGSVVQRALWDFALHITEEMKDNKKRGKKHDQPTGRRFITSNKVRDGERRSEADSFELVSRQLGFTPKSIRVTSAVLKFGGMVTVSPGGADDEPEPVEREKVTIVSDSTVRRTFQLAAALRENHEDVCPDDPVRTISYSWSDLRNLLNAYRANRCQKSDGKPLHPLAPKGASSRTDFNLVLRMAQEHGWLLKEDSEYRRTK
jgi:hypothetical protein